MAIPSEAWNQERVETLQVLPKRKAVGKEKVQTTNRFTLVVKTIVVC